MITISLHWWYVPLIVFIIGFSLSIYALDKASDWDFMPPFYMIGTFLVTMALVIGHFL